MAERNVDSDYDVHRALEVFNRKDERLAFEYSLDHIDLKVLRELVHHEPEEPMIFGYDLDTSQANILTEILGIELDFDKYIYQIGCSARGTGQQ